MPLDRGKVATALRQPVHVHEQLFNPDERQAGIDHLLHGGDRWGHHHFIIAFQFQLSILDPDFTTSVA
jgi:hypothetical protein